MKEWYVDIAIEFGRKLNPRSSDYSDKNDDFYERVSEYLGGEGFTSSMGCEVWGLETYVYVDAHTPEEAAAMAARPFREVSELVWGPGSRPVVRRVMTAEERDRELEAQGIFGE